MIEKLAVRLPDFPGAPYRARCFAHILNLVAKSIMHQFDVSGTKSDDTKESTHDLYRLAGDIETEEQETRDEQEEPQNPDDDGPSDDNNEGWVDEREDMTLEDVDDLEEAVLPVRFLLTKVSERVSNCIVLANQLTQIRKLAYAVKNSTTIVLPQWYRILEALSLEPRVIPRDIRTRWNATYDMLDFVYRYKKAINKITDIRDMKLRAYEIEAHEWEIVRQLRDVLKVSNHSIFFTMFIIVF
jgi:hypothetical protein